jgi:DNA-binding beta-propeller fold protein YncE
MNRILPLLLMSASLAAALPHASASAADAAAAPARYHLQDRWQLGPRTRWDYVDVDQVRHRLFLSRGDHVDVVDTASGKLVGTIAHTEGVHGVALAQDLKLGFTSNGRANSVTVFDLETLQPRQEVKVSGTSPDAILYDDATHKLYTFNARSSDASVFDARTMNPLATIPMGGKPEYAVTDGAGHVFANVEDKSEIAVIDTHADRILNHWPLKACEEPSGLALDNIRHRLFSVCSNRIMAVTDSLTGKQVAQLAIGGHADGAGYDAGTATVFSSNGEGSLTVVHQLDADHYGDPVRVATAKGARTMAVDHGTGAVFLPTAVDRVFTVLVVKPGP